MAGSLLQCSNLIRLRPINFIVWDGGKGTMPYANFQFYGRRNYPEPGRDRR